MYRGEVIHVVNHTEFFDKDAVAGSLSFAPPGVLLLSREVTPSASAVNNH